MSFLVTKTKKNFQTVWPPFIIFGVGSASRIPEQAKNLGISKALVVTDKGLVDTEGFKSLIETLKAAKLNHVVWSKVKADPPDTSFTETVDVYKKEGCDGIIAVGGGSSMDTAKGTGIVAMNGGKINDYSVCNPDKPPAPINKMPPLITVPTTSGTGSEITHSGVITDTTKGQKFFFMNPMVFPKASIVDPNLTISLPPYQTASTGMDALTHAVEAYVSNLENPINDPLALYAVELVAQNLRRAVHDGGDIEARTNMALASLMAGLAMLNGIPNFGHAIGHTLGTKYHLPHGIGCIITYPVALEYIRPARQEKMVKLAQAMGVNTEKMTEVEAARAFIGEVTQLMRDVSIPTLKSATKMKEADVASLAEIAVTDGTNVFCPRTFTVEMWTDILKKSLVEY